MFIEPEKLEIIQWEPSSFCNAQCIACPRTDRETLTTRQHVLDDQRYAEKQNIDDIIDSVLDRRLTNLKEFIYNGTHGDAMMHPHIDYIIDGVAKNKNIMQRVHTNGGGPWQEKLKKIGKNYLIKKPNIKFYIAVDGLEDTGHLYRRNVEWNQLKKNVKILKKYEVPFILSMNVFDHNKHQIEEFKSLATDWGGEYSIQKAWGTELVNKKIHQKSNIRLHKQKAKQYREGTYNKFILSNNDITEYDKPTTQDTCEWTEKRMIQISSDMSVWPCCYTAELGPIIRIYGKNNRYDRVLTFLTKQFNGAADQIHWIKQWHKYANIGQKNEIAQDLFLSKNNLVFDVLNSNTAKFMKKNLLNVESEFNCDICKFQCRK